MKTPLHDDPTWAKAELTTSIETPIWNSIVTRPFAYRDLEWLRQMTQPGIQRLWFVSRWIGELVHREMLSRPPSERVR